MPKKKTHEEFIKEINVKHPNIEILGTYINSKTYIKCKCKIDGYEWEAKPGNLINGTNCKMCALRKRKVNPCRPKKTHQTFIDELYFKNKNIVALDKYKGANEKIRFKCLLDDYVFEKTPASILYNPNCPKCSNKSRMNHEEFTSKLFQLNSNIEVLGTFIGVDTPIKCKCKIDGYIWSATPYNLLKNHSGCPKCSNVQRKDTEYFKTELIKINKDIEVTGEYRTAKTPILSKCKIHDCLWKTTPQVLLRGGGCPKCNQSHGERKIFQYLECNNINFEYQKEFDALNGINNGNLSYDFYIPYQNLLIEFQGEQHYKAIEIFGGEEQFKVQQEHDKRKRKYAKDNNIKLLEIAYLDFKNIEKILSRELGLVA